MNKWVMPTVIAVFDGGVQIGVIQLTAIIYDEHSERLLEASFESAKKYLLSGKEYKYIYFESEEENNIQEMMSYEMNFIKEGERIIFYER